MGTSVEFVDMDRLRMSAKVVKDTANAKEDTLTKCNRALKAMEGTTEVITAMTATLEKWNNEVQRLKLDFDQVPSSIIDHIDNLVATGKVSNADDIIALFETGELKGTITENGVDKDALSAFESKRNGKKAAMKITSIDPDEDIF